MSLPDVVKSETAEKRIIRRWKLLEQTVNK